MDLTQTVIAAMSIFSSLVLPFIAYYIRKLEKNTNSIVTQLVAITATSEHAKGKLEGIAEEKAL